MPKSFRKHTKIASNPKCTWHYNSLHTINEKLKIALHRNNNMLNRRTKILSKYRHKNKYALISYDGKD